MVVLPNGLTMAQIAPSRGTKPERLLAGALERAGAVPSYRVRLPGVPDGCRNSHVEADVALPGARLALFADGRQWHDPEYAARRQRPHHRVDWRAKAARNQARDRSQTRALEAAGWMVVRIWAEALGPKGLRREVLDEVCVAADVARMMAGEGAHVLGM
ncbi:MAG: hypothetical protein IT285_16250 [Bdellovibrionales bacterium]|nr:hypothetical protein [Bdellovibrionales bacterium]